MGEKDPRLFLNEHITYTTVVDEEARRSLQGLFRLHDKRRRKHGNDGVQSEGVSASHDRLSGASSLRKTPLPSALDNGEKPISAVYGFKYRNKLYCDQTGWIRNGSGGAPAWSC